ncbi:MAG: carboxymuconolactone decarboxylase family protein [Bacteroides sp.]
MEKATLTPQQESLAAIACLEAKGDLSRLEQAIERGFDDGLTVSQIKEALCQLYAYTGFPRALNALNTLQHAIEARTQAGKTPLEGADASPLPTDYDAVREGTAVQTKISGRPFDYTFAPQMDYYLKAHLFGDIFARDNLTVQQRELVTLSALTAIEGVHWQLCSHIQGARNVGVEDECLKMLPDVLAKRVGNVEAARLRNALYQVLNRNGKVNYQLGNGEKLGTPVDFSVWPQGGANTAYAHYFSGRSWVAPMNADSGGPVNVTFEPGCRNNWHIHHKSVQVLICVAGHGWYQEWGQAATEMVPGTVIVIPAETKHWHGAAQDSWFQHLTYMTNTQEGAQTEWLEPVDEAQYKALK